MSVIIHPSPLSSYFSNNSQEMNGIGWGIALQFHSFGLCGSEAVVTILYIWLPDCSQFGHVMFCILNSDNCEARRGEHRHCGFVKIYHWNLMVLWLSGGLKKNPQQNFFLSLRDHWA